MISENCKELKNISRREIESLSNKFFNFKTCAFPYALGFINFITKDRLLNILNEHF